MKPKKEEENLVLDVCNIAASVASVPVGFAPFRLGSSSSRFIALLSNTFQFYLRFALLFISIVIVLFSVL